VAEQDPGDGPGDAVRRDPGGELRRRLDVSSPGAVLLGTDRMLAGGPVAGAEAIAGLVEAVAAELGVAGRRAPQP
jgi:hypothetical protein